MNDDGQFGRSGEFHLSNENILLYFARRVIVVVVEPDFAPCDHPPPTRKFFELRKVRVSGQFGFVRMNPYGGVNRIVLLRNLHRAIECAGAVSSADGKHGRDTGFECTSDNLLTITVEARTVEVAMGVDEHLNDGTLEINVWGRAPSPVRPSFARRLAIEQLQHVHLSLAPTGTSSKKLASTGFPPSSEAATIIPFDSRPRSLRGARFATITTLRPTRVSGAYASAIPATI